MAVRWGWLIVLGMSFGAARAQEVGAPRSLEAVAYSPAEIRLYWLPATGATGYRITRDGSDIAVLPGTASEYADTGLAPASTHRYTVQALKGDTQSPVRTYIERTFSSFPTASGKALPVENYDVVVVQASSGGVSAAIEAARRGLKVALIEPTTRLGGMPVNGLSSTDLRRSEHASGFMARFRDRVRALYTAEGLKTDGLRYEPRIAHQAMKSLLFETPNLTVYRRARLFRVHTRDLPSPVHASAFKVRPLPNYFYNDAAGEPESKESPALRKRVEAIEVEALNAQGQPTGQRAEFRAKFFIDATDDGDLAAWAGAPFRVGREKRTAEEPHNGVIYYDRASDKLLPGSTGQADKRIQSYAYLFDVKDYGPNADKTIPKPPGYKREDFIHTPAWKQSWAVTSGKLPNDKYEINQHPQGSDRQGINYGYPTASYAERERISAEYRNQVLCYLYYIQTEQGQKQLGLPDDEYRDSGGFPPLLYVRESRRIEGELTPVEMDITSARSVVRPESIGLGDYPMDSHAVRPKTDWTTPDMGEGEWWLFKQTPWHELPLGVIVPKRLENVFVTTAVSSTHVSYGTYRLEPVRMAFGQAAGIASALGIRYGLTAREVPARQIQDELLPRFANPFGDPEIYLTYLKDVRPSERRYRAIQYLVTRGFKLADEELKPEAPTTVTEFAYLLTLLAKRAAPFFSDSSAYLGEPANPAALEALAQRAHLDPSSSVKPNFASSTNNPPITRGEIAKWLVGVFPAIFPLAVGPERYSDITDSATKAAAEALTESYITSFLWDGPAANAPNDRLKFQPDAPLSHADLLTTLFFVDRHLGPLFFENPMEQKTR